MNHTSEIKLQVELDENRIPERLFWEAPDGGIAHQEAKALFLSVWDHKSKEALRIDLWTKDMPLEEMNIFFWEITRIHRRTVVFKIWEIYRRARL